MSDKTKAVIKEIVNEVIIESDIKSIIEQLLNEQASVIIEKVSEFNNDIKEKELLMHRISQIQGSFNELEIENKHLSTEVQENQRKYSNVLLEKDKLYEELNEMEKEKENIKNKEKRLIQEVTELNKIIEQKNSELAEMSQILSQVQDKYKPYNQICTAYEKFIALSEDTRYRLSNIFTSVDVYGFMAAGMQWENIVGVWEFIKRKVIENENDDFEELHYIFLVLFEIFNKQGNERMYRLINPASGSVYDNDKQDIIGTKTDGIVQKVALEGIEMVKTCKVLKKALVTV